MDILCDLINGLAHTIHQRYLYVGRIAPQYSHTSQRWAPERVEYHLPIVGLQGRTLYVRPALVESAVHYRELDIRADDRWLIVGQQGAERRYEYADPTLLDQVLDSLPAHQLQPVDPDTKEHVRLRVHAQIMRRAARELAGSTAPHRILEAIDKYWHHP